MRPAMAIADTAETNRYLNARRNSDFTIDQDWASYTPAEHDRWDRLFRRSQTVLRARACDEFLTAMNALALSEAGIPDMAKLSDRLEKLTGWRVVPVVELVPDDVFFNHLANRRLHPAGSADGLPRRARHLPRRVRARAAARQSRVRRFHAGLRQRRTARARPRLPQEPRAALLVHGRVRIDPRPAGPAHFRRRH